MNDDFTFKQLGPGSYTVSGTMTMEPGKSYEFKLISAQELSDLRNENLRLKNQLRLYQDLPPETPIEKKNDRRIKNKTSKRSGSTRKQKRTDRK